MALALAGLAGWTPAPGTVAARTRLFLRLDPRFAERAEPGAVGSLSVVARGDLEAEASAWLAHAPGPALHADDGVVGDVRTLFVRPRFGPAWVAVGRQWTTIGGQRFEMLDGVTGGVEWGPASLRVRAGLGRGDAVSADALGEAREAGAEVAFAPWTGGGVTLGVLGRRAPDTVPETLWTAAVDHVPSPWWSARAAATADAAARTLVDARLELAGRPTMDLWLRGFARHTRLDRLLDPGDLLAVFAADARDEAGAVIDWQLAEAWSIWGEAAALHGAGRTVAGRWRAGLELRPAEGAALTAEGTLLLDRPGRTAIGRLGARWPLAGSLFGTVEAVAVADDAGPSPVDHGAGRAGLGLEPLPGWTAYGAVEVERSTTRPRRVAGLVLIERALGAPPRRGGAP